MAVTSGSTRAEECRHRQGSCWCGQQPIRALIRCLSGRNVRRNGPVQGGPKTILRHSLRATGRLASLSKIVAMELLSLINPRSGVSLPDPRCVDNALRPAPIERRLRAHMSARAAVVAVALVLFVGMVHAQPSGGEPRYWVGAAGGSATLGDDRCNPESFLVSSAEVCDDQDVGFKVYAGRALNEYLGVEVFGARLGEASFKAARFFSGFGLRELTVTGRHKFSVGAVGMLRVPLKRLEVFLKGGPHRWSRETVYRNEVIEANATGFDLAWGLGAQYPLHRRLSVRFEVERLVIDEDDLNFVSAGLAVHF